MEDACWAPFPVTFEPHWADERMLWLTGGSIVVSGALGFLAYWNGRRAGQIAEDASLREEKRIADEAAHQKQQLRKEVAIAMSSAVVACEYLLSSLFHGDEGQIANAEQAANRALMLALSLINVHVAAPANSELAEWLGESIVQMRETVTRRTPDRPTLDRLTAHTLGQIHEWSNRQLQDTTLPTRLLR